MKRYRATVSAVSDGGDAPAGWVKVALANGSSETDWAEYPQLARGNGYGLWLPPVVGERVIVDFADEDELLEEPIIIRSSWDEENAPPSTDLERVVLKLPSDVPVEIQVGTLKLRILEDRIEIEGSSGAWHNLARADKVEARLQALETWAGSHTHVNSPGAFGIVTTAQPTTDTPPSTAADATATQLARVKE
jgi:Type VI secretion system/phage-baseplate injector OB domain